MKNKRTKNIFIAFTGPKIKQQKVFHIDSNFECWNLDKFSIDEFIEKIKGVISPVNNNALRNYKKKDTTNRLKRFI